MQILYPILHAEKIDRMMSSGRALRLRENKRKYLDRLKEDWRKYFGFIENEHPLIRALKEIVAITPSLDHAYGLAQNQVEQIATNLGWFGGRTEGRFLNEPFFFKDKFTPEAVILVNEEVNRKTARNFFIFDEKTTWMEWCPIKVKMHNYTDMDYEITCQNPSSMVPRKPMREDGINIIEIDLAFLYLQYRCWKESSVSQVDGVELGIGNFLLSYPLANMIESQMEVAYFNRLYCYLNKNTPIGNRSLNKRHVNMGTYQDIDETIKEVSDRLYKYGGMTFDKFIANIPSLGQSKHYLDLFRIPEITINRRTELILLISVLPLYEIWLNYIKQTQQQRWNTKTISLLKKEFHYIANKSLYDTIPDKRIVRFKDRILSFSKSL